MLRRFEREQVRERRRERFVILDARKSVCIARVF
jgi:hypothetical protein